MAAKFTAALEVDLLGAGPSGLHLTLCFCDAKKAKKIATSNSLSYDATIIAIEYWSNSNLTVAVISSVYANERHKYYNDHGYGYDHEFIPHATLGKGDLTKKFAHLVNFKPVLGPEYVRIWEK